MTERPIVIFGSGEIATLARFYFANDSEREIIAYCVDDANADAPEFDSLPLLGLGELQDAYPPGSVDMFVALSYRGLNTIRAARYLELKEMGYGFASYVSSRATTWPDLYIGENCFVLEDQTIQPSVRLGNNVMLWSGNHIGHGTEIGDHTYLASQIVVSGHCKIGKRCFIGVNATLRDFCNVGDDCFIGMGAAVTRDMPKGAVAVASGTEIYDADDRRSRALKKRYFNHGY